MRVLVLSNMYPPHHLGGYELSCRDVVTRWRRAGHEVVVLTTDFTVDGADVPADEDPSVHRTLQWYWRDHVFVRPSAWGRLKTERHNQRVFRRVLRELRPDVLSVWHMGGMSLGLLSTAARAALPVVYVVCDEWPSYAPKHDAWLSAWTARPRLARFAETTTRLPSIAPRLEDGTMVFVSEFMRQRMIEETGVRAERFFIVPSGVDEGDFPVEVRPARPWSWRLLCVGRVEPRKGFRTAVEALAACPAATLQIVGPADLTHRDELLALARDHGVSDRLSFSSARRSELAEVYRAADALLFTSAWQEPFGLVPVEAMACSTPVIACATGGSAEFLRDGVNCLTVPAQDTGALVAALDRLAGDPNLRATLVDGGRTTASQLTIGRYAGVLEALHVDAMKGRR